MADTGVDPIPHMIACRRELAERPKAELLWASPRELLNVFHAEKLDATSSPPRRIFWPNWLSSARIWTEYSLETVRMFHRDATQSGFQIADGMNLVILVC